MGLTKDTIIANDQLRDLSDEQIEAVVTLSQNSEDELFRVKMGEHYRKLDASIEEHSGVARNGDEKTYDYLPRAIDVMKAQYEAKEKALKDEYNALKEKGDDGLKSKIESLTKELETAKSEYQTLKESAETDKTNYAKALNDYKIDNEIARSLDGIAFKSGINSELLSTAKERAINNIKSKNPTFEERDGKQRLVFYEGDKILLNKENQLNPYTAKELLVEEFSKLDVLNSRPKAGAGGEGNKPKGGSSVIAETQTEAMSKIDEIVRGMGFKKGNADYQAEVNRLWAENKCSSLPMK